MQRVAGWDEREFPIPEEEEVIARERRTATGSAITKLLLACSPSYAGGNPALIGEVAEASDCVKELMDLLQRRNGCYAFESALHIFGVGAENKELDILFWNEETTWRHYYDDLVAGYFFFAEDAFGGQFAIKDNGVYFVDPETGEAKLMGSSLEEWAQNLILDFEYWSGFPLCHDWQVGNRALEPGERLMPKCPFVLGGKYETENLWASNAVTGMQYRGYIASQLRDLPDGTQVNLEFVKKS